MYSLEKIKNNYYENLKREYQLWKQAEKDVAEGKSFGDLHTRFILTLEKKFENIYESLYQEIITELNKFIKDAERYGRKNQIDHIIKKEPKPVDSITYDQSDKTYTILGLDPEVDKIVLEFLNYSKGVHGYISDEASMQFIEEVINNLGIKLFIEEDNNKKKH